LIISLIFMNEKEKKTFWENNLKIDPASVAFDIDGVCADTMNLFLDILRQDFNINSIRYEDITCYTLEKCLPINQDVIFKAISKILEGNYRAWLKPLDGAIDALTRIGNHSSPILFVTARPNAGPIDEWLNKLLPLRSDQIEIIATGSFEAKTDVLLQKNKAYFVEDRLETCFSLLDAGITPLLFHQPWNREKHPFIEVKNWKELEALMALQTKAI